MFLVRAKGSTASEAFAAAVLFAKMERGEAGSRGGIAEKGTFAIIRCPTKNPTAYAQKLLWDNDPRISEIWSPAGCIRHDDDWIFFGFAAD
jgi:hypothetical protein